MPHGWITLGIRVQDSVVLLGTRISGVWKGGDEGWDDGQRGRTCYLAICGGWATEDELRLCVDYRELIEFIAHVSLLGIHCLGASSVQ